jgi:hypothetical protein
MNCLWARAKALELEYDVVPRPGQRPFAPVDPD